MKRLGLAVRALREKLVRPETIHVDNQTEDAWVVQLEKTETIEEYGRPCTVVTVRNQRTGEERVLKTITGRVVVR